eukprot:m.385091 g.385091  ORF g.385091 m.385091 type:complete len:103 (+) comp20050_c8_seq11:3181-3489(+)
MRWCKLCSSLAEVSSDAVLLCEFTWCWADAVCFLCGCCAGVVVVSHDARLITECECELWEVADGTCKQFDGDFDDYKEAVLERLEDPEVVEVEGRRVDASDA